MDRPTILFALVAVLLGCDDPCPPLITPPSDDPRSDRQWYLEDLGVPDAWAAAEGGRPVVVAIIDNGFDLSHEDLAPRLWTNGGEVPGNGEDDDGNGYVDDVHGVDLLDRDGDPSLETGLDVSEGGRLHGTAAAGIVGAATDNGVGVASTCTVCELLLIRARDFGDTRTSAPLLAEAVDYAVAAGAQVVSISDGVLEARVDEVTEAVGGAAFTAAHDAGALVVASAGNDGAEVLRWPARHEHVLAVAAVDPGGRPTAWTNFGDEVALAAPGECVYTTTPDGYGSFSGTSASAPIVAGLAATLFALRPDWGPDQVAERMRSTATPISGVRAGRMGSGLVHFGHAVAGL